MRTDRRSDRRMAGQSVFNGRSSGYRMLLKAENVLTGVYITFKSYVFVLFAALCYKMVKYTSIK
jgi:hypothetical protein